MQKRSPITVALLILVTFGIYGIVWQVKTKGEMNKLGANIPTAWLLIIPLVNIYWLWKYSEGVEQTTKGQMSAILSFVLLYLLSIIGAAVVQDSFNKIGSVPAQATTAPQDASPATPETSATPEAPAAPLAPATPSQPAPTAPTPPSDTPPAPTV
jgi:hypothetical protein